MDADEMKKIEEIFQRNIDVNPKRSTGKSMIWLKDSNKP